MRSRLTADITVVGAGAFGSWIALLASRAGRRVTLIDQYGPANDRSSSTGESRIVRSAYGADEIYTAMAQRSLRLWKELLAEEGCGSHFRQTGVLWMADAGEPALRDAQAVFGRLGIEHEWLDANTISRRLPQFRVPDNAVVLWEPQAGVLLAERSVQTVLAAAKRNGVSYEVGKVMPPGPDGARIEWIDTADGHRFESDLFVFACGSWLPKLFPRALAHVIRPTRQELFFFDPGRDELHFKAGSLPAWIDQTNPSIPYGFPDFGDGVKLGFHHLGPDFDPDTGGRDITPAQISEAADYLAARFPAMQDGRLRSTRVCHYENTPNGDLLIDRHPEIENVWFAGGGSGHGFKHAPGIAEYLVRSIEGAGDQEPRFSLSTKQQLAPGRVL
ncbi:MAG: FAD-dependent oxidoreductase [Acidobacteriaceae bacterium]|nr:FAD-dependent oxidoreductase [Acidobacteriaceae bacterium]